MKSYLRLIVILLVLYIPSQVEGQTTKERRAASRKAKIERRDRIARIPNNSFVSLSLVNALVPFPRINIGYITPLNDKWSYGGSAGIGFNALPDTTGERENYFLWELRPEIIYYIGRGEKYRNFIGIELFHINSRETIRSDNFDPVNDLNGTIELVGFDSADYERNKSGFLFNFGEFTRLSDKLMVLTKFGLGVRFKDNIYSNVANQRLVSFGVNEVLFVGDTSVKRREGLSVGLELNFDLRLVYKLD